MHSDTRPSTVDEKDGLGFASRPDSADSSQHKAEAVLAESGGRSKDEPSSEAPVALRSTELYPETDLDNNIIAWDSQDDPENPKNFSNRVKWTTLFLVSSITFVSPLASSMFAPGVSFMNAEFNNHSTTISTFAVSVFVLGYSIGPLFLSPLSEIYGRATVLNYSNFFFAVWQIGCALAPNIQCLIIFRLLCGIGGSGCLTIGGGVISDLFPAEQRGRATAIYTVGPLFGPVLGPICGGFLAQRVGWRWVFWLLFIAASLATILIWKFNRETNPRIILARKVLRQRELTGNKDLESWYDRDTPPRSKRAVLAHGLIRPLKFLLFSPIVALLSLYMATTYGLLYLLFTTITSVFEVQYGWEPEMTGLAFVGIGLGLLLGVAAVAKLSDATVIRLAARNGGVAEPEMRLPACIIFGMFLPVSLFWYGWAAERHTHWIVPILGMVPFGFGMMGIFIPVQTYLIDAFPEYAASAIAALTAVRSLFGAFLPMAGPAMYRALGLGWGNTLLGCLAVVLLPFLPLVYKYGGAVRRRWPVDLK